MFIPYWKMKTRNEINISNCEDQYEFDESIWNNDDEDIADLKRIITYELTDPERRMIIFYAECGSLRTLAKKIGVSVSTAQNEIKKIQMKVKTKFYGIN